MNEINRAAYITALQGLLVAATDAQLDTLWCTATKMILEQGGNRAMTDKELWELRLSLIKDVMTLTDKQVQYIINQLNAAQGPAGVHTEALP